MAASTYADETMYLQHLQPAPYDNSEQGMRHLSAVLPAVSAVLGSPVTTAIHKHPGKAAQALGWQELIEAQITRAVVVLVDGLGYNNLELRSGHAPNLRAMLHSDGNNRPIRTCIPSTTTVAMGVFGTGTCPGLTGMTGYTQRNPYTGKLAQLISFKDAPEPSILQQQPTVFETLSERGMRVTSVGMKKFAHSALTRAALHGGTYLGNDHVRDMVNLAARTTREPGLTYLYLRDVDKMAHRYGLDTDRWVASFERIDSAIGQLRHSVEPGTLIVITADHGLLNAEEETRIDIANEPELQRSVALVAGEARAVSLYLTPDESPEDVAARWQHRLESRARVILGRDAIEQGWYGRVDAHVRGVIGDVLVFANGTTTIVDSRTQSENAQTLPSVHGSLTRMESEIPCIAEVIE